MKLAVFVVAVLFSLAMGEKVRYDGYKVLRFVPESQVQLKLLSSIYTSDLKVDFWAEPSKEGRPVDVMVAPSDLYRFVNMAKKAGLEHRVLIDDVQKLIDAEKVAPKGSRLTWDQYYEFEDILAWTDEVASANSDFVTLEKIGESFEGREMRVMRINKPSNGPKVGVYLESQIHAREWITTATATYIIDQFLNNPDYADVLDNFDIHYVPVTNPDGVVYTQETDRLWRKTRSTNAGTSCVGADPNRNWDASFGGPGTSPDPCSEIYHGTGPFSESETKAVSDYLTANQASISLFVDIHSFSQLVLLPWGDKSELPEDYDELYAMGKVFETNVATLYGTEYVTGNIADVIYLAAGGSVDWVKEKTSIKYSQALELRDTGDFGFLLPADQILPSGEETLMGLLAEMNAIRDAVLAKHRAH